MFLQPLMLFGLAALSIPIIIHLLNRRRFEVVDWGAMRFLQMSKVTRRRIFIEELLLMLLRMALLAFLVFAVARMIWGADWLAWMQPHRSRDVVLIFDGSASMNCTNDGVTPQDAAKEWAADYIKGLAPGDGAAVLQARQQVLPIISEPSQDLRRYVAESIRDMPRPSGGCDLPRAVEEAHRILAGSRAGERDIIVLTDGQAFGWSDDATEQRWKDLADQTKHEKPSGNRAAPGLWVVNVDPKREPNPPNWSLDPLSVDFPVIPVNSEVTFKTYIRMHGSAKYTPPPDGLELDVDGQLVRRLPAPPAAGLGEKQVQMTFTHRFSSPGTHLVTLSVKPDEKQDALPDDDRTDYAVDVTPPMPILYVDGNPDSAQLKKLTREQTLLGALALEKDTTPALKVSAVSISDFTKEMLTAGKEDDRPRVLVLCNVASLNDDQQKAVAAFLEGGGGVLATLGGRVSKDEYNKMYSDGLGWLPAALVGIEGDEAEKDEGAKARVAVADLPHPIMDRYRTQTSGGLSAAYFPKWWQVDLSGPNARGVCAANLSTDKKPAPFPFLVERRFGAGRVLLCTVPLDSLWGTNLPTLPDFVPLVHDLVYYLAGARASEFNLQPGQPITYRLASSSAATGFRLQPPFGPERPLSLGLPTPDAFAAQETREPRHALVCDETREVGVYRLRTPDGGTDYYVVQGSAGESDLKAANDSEREDVAKIVPMQYENDPKKILAPHKTADRPDDWSIVFLVGMIILLCGEVWMTRRMVKNRS
ncbi:MAG TPA: BatA domain-containing protein [Gemmataceae bacterium]|nr:BatA domain-containing protein [Gemmataceae bacterium]